MKVNNTDACFDSESTKTSTLGQYLATRAQQLVNFHTSLWVRENPRYRVIIETRDPISRQGMTLPFLLSHLNSFCSVVCTEVRSAIFPSPLEKYF